MTPERVVARILDRIDKQPDGCWLWTGALYGSGYGHVAWQVDGRQFHRGVHRVMYEAFVGPIPDGFDVDHQCHEPSTCSTTPASACPHRRCCNPTHLRAVTRQANLLRGGTVPAARAAITECPAGHAYDLANTAVVRGSRVCRECTRERNRAYYWRHRERRKAYNKAYRERQAR